MKKTCQLIFPLLALGDSAARAQNKPNAFPEVFGGVASPSGNFAKSDSPNLMLGFAKSGSPLGIQGTVFFGDNMGRALRCRRVQQNRQ